MRLEPQTIERDLSRSITAPRETQIITLSLIKIKTETSFTFQT